MNYWLKRILQSQYALTDKSIAQTEKQLVRYYRQAARRVMSDFESTYNKLLETVDDGKEPTPADLYKLDKYWQMQGQMRAELRKLGERQIATLTKEFEAQYFEIYYSFALEGVPAYNTIDTAAVQQLLKGIWVADGKSWSERVWQNTELLAATLNEEMINCVATGKKTSELKNILQNRFNVSYSNADMLVRTEMAHIQTQAAQQRYKDYGIQEVEVYVDEDERTCPVCAQHEGERYPINAQMPIPFHPRCRCCVLPVIDNNQHKEEPSKPAEPVKRDRVRRLEDRNSKPDFYTMDKNKIKEWSKENLKTNIDYKGATIDASREAAELLMELERKGFDLGETKIVFSGTDGNYGNYNPITKTVNLRPNTNFVERMMEEDMRAKYKLGKPQHAVSSYKGMMAHELGHAIDDISGLELSGAIARNKDLYSKAIKISNYAGTGGAIGTNRANEAFAENFSAYLTNNEMDEEIKEIIEEYLRKKKRK